jgi:hypothetical protein
MTRHLGRLVLEALVLQAALVFIAFWSLESKRGAVTPIWLREALIVSAIAIPPPIYLALRAHTRAAPIGWLRDLALGAVAGVLSVGLAALYASSSYLTRCDPEPYVCSDWSWQSVRIAAFVATWTTLPAFIVLAPAVGLVIELRRKRTVVRV